jgi:hypothetical protein
MDPIKSENRNRAVMEHHNRRQLVILPTRRTRDFGEGRVCRDGMGVAGDIQGSKVCGPF